MGNSSAMSQDRVYLNIVLLMRVDQQHKKFGNNSAMQYDRALRQFGPKTNWDRKPNSDQRQIRTQF